MAEKTVQPTRQDAAAHLFSFIASTLFQARELLTHDHEGSCVDGAMALIQRAGALADRGCVALGSPGVMGDDQWHFTDPERKALAALGPAHG